MLIENRRTKDAIAVVAIAVGGVAVLSTNHWPFAMCKDFVIHGGLNGVCHASRDRQQLT